MRRFTQLFNEIDTSNRTQDKVSALKQYFADAPPEDAAWALFFLTGNRLRMPVNTRNLRQWVADVTDYPGWLVEECYGVVGDLAETLALLLGNLESSLNEPTETGSLCACIETFIQPLRDLPDNEKRRLLFRAFSLFNHEERFVFIKLITGAFRMGVQRTLVTRALAELAGIEAAVMAHRLMGDWHPNPEAYQRLLDPDARWEDPGRPYPFYLAYPLEERSTSKTGDARDPVNLMERFGDPRDWCVEWKYDGIRAQLLVRGGQILLWSRGEDLITDRFPEITEAARGLPDGVVLDGEILAWKDGRPLDFGVLQKRIGRKHVSKKILQEAPVIFKAYDCLEFQGEDIRGEPLSRRQEYLERVLEQARESSPPSAPEAGVRAPLEQLELGALLNEDEAGASAPPREPVLQRSMPVEAPDWDSFARLRATSRDQRVEGFMIKRKASAYGVGRTRGDWWKWKIDPYTIDGVMIYAQAGHGRRAGLYTDFTFGVWDGPDRQELVTVCKAYSGLTDEEFQEVNRWIQKHTLDRRGPVRMVEPELVFEIAFEGINLSDRHKSGLAFRFPRMSRWRKDKSATDADSLETIRALLGGQ